MMGLFKFMLVALFVFIFLGCERVLPFQEESEKAAIEVSDLNQATNSSDAKVELASLPEPDGIPILVSLGKSFWVLDPTDPTPFVNLVYLYSHIFLINDYCFGEYVHTDSGWLMRSYSDTNLVRLIWVNDLKDTLNFTLYVDEYEFNQQFERFQVKKGRINFFKNKRSIYNSNFHLVGDSLWINETIVNVFQAQVSALRIAKSPNFVGTISAEIINLITEKTTSVLVNCNSDSTRTVRVSFRRFNIDFLIRANVSKIKIATYSPRFREVTGDFFANNIDVGDLNGIKYEFEDATHKSYLVITLRSGKRINLW